MQFDIKSIKHSLHIRLGKAKVRKNRLHLWDYNYDCMNAPIMASSLEKVKEKLEDGLLKECLLLLKDSVMNLALEEPVKYRFRNNVSGLLSRCNSLLREKAMIAAEEYQLFTNKLTADTLDSVTQIELEIKKSTEIKFIGSNGKKYKVQLELEMDFEKTTDEEIQEFLSRLRAIIKTNPDELTVMNKRPGSIIISTELSAEAIVKIKSFEKLGVLKRLKSVKVLSIDWNWIEDEQDFHVYLPYADLSGAELSGANLSEAELSGAKLAWAKLGGAKLSGANLSGANLFRATLFSANLSETKLPWTNLNGANLKEADLTGATLFRSNLCGAKLSGADLRGVNLKRVDLRGGDMREARLGGANLDEANLSRADLTGADLSDVDLSDVILVRAIFNSIQPLTLTTEKKNKELNPLGNVTNDRDEKAPGGVHFP